MMNESQLDLLKTLKVIAGALQRAHPRNGFEYTYVMAEQYAELFELINQRAAEGWELYYSQPPKAAFLRRPRKEQP
jgi:hypothetical protein